MTLEEAGLTPAPAESTLPLGCLGHTPAWEMNHLLLGMKWVLFSLLSLLELLLRWLQAGERLESSEQSICWDTSLLDPHANKCPKSIHRNN